MKKEMTLSTPRVNLTSSNFSIHAISALSRRFVCHLRIVMMLTRCYSRLLEKEINAVQTLYLLNAQIGFLAMALLANLSFWCALFGLIWLVIGMLLCKRTFVLDFL